MARREHDYEAGDTIRGEGGDYLVLKILGSGGMGAVYLVRDKNIGKRFVLKILHRRLAQRRDLIVRVEHEARALGNLSPHEGIIEIFNQSWTRDRERMPYYLMEALSGETLADALRRHGSLELVSALGTGVKVLSALGHAHDRGVIHRDVKPDNVFLHGETGVKLLDFGILKLAAAAEDSGMFIGTPRYAAPEQLRGGTVGAPADVYAVGVMLFHMLTGRHPFERFGPSLEEMMQTLITPAPSLDSMGDFDPALVALVDSALAKEPGRRPRDAYTFASQLHAIHVSVGSKRDKDPHTHVTVEARVEPARQPSLITMAHLAEPTSPDPDNQKLVEALHAEKDGARGGRAPGDGYVTGFESTARDLVPSPAQPLVSPEHDEGGGAQAKAAASAAAAGIDRSALTAAPSSPVRASATPASIRYLTNAASDGAGDAPAPSKVQHTAPLLPRKVVPQHRTVPMIGRPSRDSATPEPQELEARSVASASRSKRAPSASFVRRLRRLVELRALVVASVIVAGTLTVMSMRDRAASRAETSGAAAMGVSAAAEPLPRASGVAPAPALPESPVVRAAGAPAAPAAPAADAGISVAAVAPSVRPAAAPSAARAPTRLTSPSAPTKNAPRPEDIKFE